MKLFDRLGRFKFRVMRLMFYASGLQMCMVTYLFIRDAGWHWWYLLVLVGVGVAYQFEKHHGLAQEQYLALSCNPEWNRFIKQWEEHIKKEN
jgi:hypothetical protein